jgi:XTP/dITP diphosphohydrolase
MRERIETLLLGTGNQGKLTEIRAALHGTGIKFLSLRDFPSVPSVNETGATYEENAILKACTYARATGHWTMADDSGLEVAALQGAPGVLSARYAGARASDNERIAFVLEQLKTKQGSAHLAQFTSVLALADPQAHIAKIARGVCSGCIVDSPRGTNGFGYDPIFIPEGFEFTFGELTGDIKDQISHRAVALRQMAAFLAELEPST